MGVGGARIEPDRLAAVVESPRTRPLPAGPFGPEQPERTERPHRIRGVLEEGAQAVEFAVVEEAGGPFQRRLRIDGSGAKAGLEESEGLVDISALPLEVGQRQPRVQIVRVGGQAFSQDVAQVGRPGEGVGRNRRRGLRQQAKRLRSARRPGRTGPRPRPRTRGLRAGRPGWPAGPGEPRRHRGRGGCSRGRRPRPPGGGMPPSAAAPGVRRASTASGAEGGTRASSLAAAAGSRRSSVARTWNRRTSGLFGSYQLNRSRSSPVRPQS